jgi:hypothetical protein
MLEIFEFLDDVNELNGTNVSQAQQKISQV